MFKPKKYVLPSGLKVVLVPMQGSPTSTVEVLVETGSKYESRKELGLSHFLEHMCFKGTKKRPSALDVSKELDNLGAVSNAFTSTEVTGYWAKVSAQNTLKVLDIVADIYLNAIFKPEDIEIEKGVIIEEMNRAWDQPERLADKLFDGALHGDQPAGRPVIGTKESVKSFRAKDFYDYRKKHYVAKATTIVVAGHFNEKLVLKAIKELFKDISRAKKHGKVATKIVHKKPIVVSAHKDVDQIQIQLGTRSFPYRDGKNSVLAVLRGVLSSGMSSRLFQKMREELGICYSVRAFQSISTDHGEFGIIAGVDPKRVDIAVNAIMEELRKLKEEEVPEQELSKVKSLMISGMYMSLESSDQVADYFADRSIFYGDLRLPQKREKIIKSVTSKQIKELAQKVFTNKDLLLAVVGRNPNKKQLEKILKF